MPEEHLRRAIARARAISFTHQAAERTNYRSLLELATVGITRTDTGTGRIHYANEAFCRMVGYSPAELSEGKLSFVELTHPDDRAKNIALHKSFIAGELPHYAVEKRYMRKDGTCVWGRTIVTRMKRTDSRIDETFAVILDIAHEMEARERQEISIAANADGEALSTRKASPRLEAVHRYILENWSQPLTVERLIEVARLPRRSFFTSFRRLYGSSPKLYIKQQRLEKARAFLLSAGHVDTVSSIARRCGFANLGHFAKDYKRRYGELPSDTLRDCGKE